MTGRRAMRGPDERLSRALQFIPGHVGGRVASAQPIRRRGGTLRRVSIGGAAVSVGWINTEGDRRTAAGAFGETSLAGSATDGDLLVWAAAAIGFGTTTPGDWTSLATGSVGTLSYQLAWTIYDSATTTTDAFTLTGTGTQGTGFTYIFRNPGALEPVITSVTTQASSLSATFKTPPSGAALPFQVVAHDDTTNLGYTYSADVSAGNFTQFGGVIGSAPYDAIAHEPSGLFPPGSTVTHTSAGPWWSVAVGLA